MAASAVALLVVLFAMNWYTVPRPFTTGLSGLHNVNGWHGVSHLRWVLLVTVIAALALFVLQATRRSPALPATFSLIVMFLGGLSVIWLLIRVAINPPGGRCWGGWVGLTAAAVLTWGAYWSLRKEGIAPSDAPADIPTVKLPPPEPPAKGEAPPPAEGEAPPPADRS